MGINDLLIVKKILPIILKAQSADSEGLRQLRRQLIVILDEVGHKNFVTIAADVLKNNFKVEGCNDARVPLKRIFAVSLKELEMDLASQSYNLSESHPLVFLTSDHKDNIEKLKALDLSVKNGPAKAKDFISYYKDLDLHIRKEEEVFFPVLEACGMKEHPDNLKDEHKGFREILIEVTEKQNLSRFSDKFVPDICNHIFRETYIFYPAALEFIADKKQWDKIKEGFSLVDKQ